MTKDKNKNYKNDNFINHKYYLKQKIKLFTVPGIPDKFPDTIYNTINSKKIIKKISPKTMLFITYNKKIYNIYILTL